MQKISPHIIGEIFLDNSILYIEKMPSSDTEDGICNIEALTRERYD